MIARLLPLALFCLPYLLYVLAFRRLPGRGAHAWQIGLAAAGLVLALSGLVWYGEQREFPPDSAYTPARMGPDGRIIPGHTASQDESKQ